MPCTVCSVQCAVCTTLESRNFAKKLQKKTKMAKIVFLLEQSPVAVVLLLNGLGLNARAAMDRSLPLSFSLGVSLYVCTVHCA